MKRLIEVSCACMRRVLANLGEFFVLHHIAATMGRART